MSRTHCAACGHKYTNQGNDHPHAAGGLGGLMEVSRGGGVCRPCFLKAGHSKECGACGKLAAQSMKFCHECGTKFGAP